MHDQIAHSVQSDLNPHCPQQCSKSLLVDCGFYLPKIQIIWLEEREDETLHKIT